jgi:hypothetical protein
MSRLSLSVLQAAALAAVFAASCVNKTTDDDDDNDNDNNAATGGSGDDGTGGKDATGGTSGETGGSGWTAPEGANECPTPTTALITDFTLAEDATSTTEASWGDFTTTFSGGTLVYPDSVTSDVSDNNWHLSGTVEDYTGFGFYFSVPAGGCGLIDASAFKGFSFKVSGTLPSGRSLKMWVATAATAVSYDWYTAHDITDKDPGFGRCQPQSDNEYDGTCKNGEAAVPVTDTEETVTLKWADFVGGKPESTPNTKEITSFGFYVSWSGADDSPYEFDITFDDLSFLE